MPISVDHDERRQKVATVVVDIIAAAGLDAVTVRSVAKAAGFSTAVVSHYFSSMRHLLLFTYRISQSRAYARLETAVRNWPRQPHRAVESLLPYNEEARRDWLVWSVFWAMAIADPDFSTIQREQFRQARQRFENLLRAAGGVRVSRSEIDAKARSLLTTLIGLSIQATFDPQEWPKEKQRALLRDAMDRHFEAA